MHVAVGSLGPVLEEQAVFLKVLPQGDGTRPCVPTSIKRSHPPFPPFQCCAPAGVASAENIVFFRRTSSPDDLQSNIEGGGKGGRGGLY